MKTVDVWQRYYAARCLCNGRQRHAASVKLTATSDEGTIAYEASVSFFPHDTEEDYAVSYDAVAARELFRAKGRRSNKRDAALPETLRDEIDALAKTLEGEVFWDSPLQEARYG